jgi:hyperosmotically inducible periplasmic protein
MKRSLILAAVLMSTASLAVAEDKDTDRQDARRNQADAAQYDVDNTGRNVRDREYRNITADNQQPEGDKLVQQVRKAIVGDDSLSTNAKNVKVVSDGRRVVLRGPVETAREKSLIEQFATTVAGSGNVDNQLEVKNNKRQ